MSVDAILGKMYAKGSEIKMFKEKEERQKKKWKLKSKG
jgi:hypothetical protein